MQILEVGSCLGNRYEIMEKIGEGGMAEVYRGQDALLNRAVAIKVLRPQYANDQEFVERFRREAQAAASLSHPNIVSIFDVGQDGGIYYIVMEYIRGENLKEIIRKDAPLAPLKVAEIGIQICDALSCAHQNGVIHRDVKPHNILITKDGRVKVTDFGIARAANSTSLTETGIIIGSVHYFSPEQAKGAPVGLASDLYSLGIILYELLTGRVPFSGESPIATALQHINGTATDVCQLNRDVPAALEKIVMRALEKDPKKRYRSASEFSRALKSFITSFDEKHQVQGDTIILKREDYGELFDVERVEDDDFMAAKKGNRKKRSKSKKQSGSIFKGLVSFLILMGIFAFLAVWGFQKIPALLYVPEVAVPNVEGKPLVEAERLLKDRRLVPKVWREIYDPDVPRGNIIDQTPGPDDIVKANRTILLTVSKGPEMVQVPDLRGKSLREAEIALSSQGLIMGTKEYKNFPGVEEGLIAAQNPIALSKVKSGTKIDLTLSRGSAMAKVPDLMGLSDVEAEQKLIRAGFLKGTVIEDYSGQVPKGKVMAQDPPPGEDFPVGAKVDFMLSKGSGTNDNDTPKSQGDSPGSGWMTGYNVTIVIPPGPSRQRVRIVVQDVFGEREAYNEIHRPGDRILKYLQGTGNVKIRVFIDGNLYKEFPEG